MENTTKILEFIAANPYCNVAAIAKANKMKVKETKALLEPMCKEFLIWRHDTNRKIWDNEIGEFKFKNVDLFTIDGNGITAIKMFYKNH